MRPRRPSSPGLWLAFALAACGCSKQDKPSRKVALDLLPPTLDLGVLVQNEPARAALVLRNLGTTEVPLRSAASNARCLWQDLPSTIAPGATVHLSVLCQSDLLGPLKESLILQDAAQGTELARLEIAGKIEPTVGFDTVYVDLRPDFGRTTSIDVHLIGRQAAMATPKVTSTGDDGVTAAPLTSDGGHVQGFRLSCRGSRVGMHAGSLMVDTGVAAQPTLALSWGCRVPGTLDVEPANPYFNLRASGDRALQVLVRSRQPGFVVRSARVVEGPFRATLERPSSDGSTPITVRVDNAGVPDQARAATGTLVIESNDRREPRREVPLFGFGKVNKAVAPDPN